MRDLGRGERYGLVVLAVVVLAVAAAAVFVLLRHPPAAQAPRLRLDAAALRPESAAVSGGFAAWSDRGRDGRTAIVLYDSSSATTRTITDPRVECSQPAVAGDTVVYVDHRDPEGDLYRYDAGSGRTSPFVVAAGRQGAPAAAGDWVVWEDDRTSYGPRVRAKRLSGGGEIAVPAARPGGVQRRPRVAGSLVVWEEYEGGLVGGTNAAIYGYDLDAGRLETISPDGGVQLLPATDGRYVAWCRQRGSRLDIAVWDRRSRATTQPPAQKAERTTPAVGQGVVYWVEACDLTHLEVCTWRPGDTTTTALAAGVAVDQMGITAAQGSRAWFEHRGGGWYVEALLSGREAATATATSSLPSPRTVVPGFSDAGAARLVLVQDGSPPTPPSAPVASALGTGGVLMEWRPSTDDVGVAAYEVYRAAAPMTAATLGTASRVATVTSSPASFPAAAGEAAGEYTLYYAVAAVDAAGNRTLSSNTAPDPHGTSVPGAKVETCQRCHLNPSLGPNPARRQSCYSCHGLTPATTAYGARATRDAQAEFLDDTATVFPADGSRHRNAFMTDTARECDGCHTPHRKPRDADPAASYTMLLRTQLATATSGRSGYRYDTAAAPVGNAFCFDCHGTELTPISLVGGSTAYVAAGGDHETGWAASAHGSRVPAPDADPRIQCAACHDKHASRVPRLLGRYDQPTQTNRIGATAVTGNDEGVCFACHAGPSAGFPLYSRDASGFPVRGSWPGTATWGTPYDAAAQTGSMHATATVVWPGSSYAGGDCKNCHRMHGPSDRYAILRDTDASAVAGVYAYTASDFGFCLNCHDGSPGRDIRRYVPPSAGGTAGGSKAGHATRSTGTLPAGSPLPCYDCHDPHGSASSYGLLVVTQTSAATTIAVGDTPGEIAMGPGRPAANVRQFCLSCHTTADTASGWNGSAFAGVASGALVEGIDRVAPASRLRLPSLTGHNSSDAQACYACHGNDYTTAASTNVHNPGGGVSAGGVRCYTCHSIFKETMDAAGTTRTSSFHHVLGTGTYDGDLAPFTGSYPGTLNASAQEVYCVSCHTDHNYFNADRGANLRLGLSLPGSQTTNTDFVTTAPYGVCVGCHSVAMTKDNADQKSLDASSRTPAVAGQDYAGSKHRYQVPGSFGGSVFNVDCVKCHTDGRPASFQDGTFQFQLHDSAESRLLAALGTAIPASGMTEEALCFRCHSGAGTSDAYGASTMTTTSKSLQTVFASAYKHPIAATSGVHRSDEDMRTAPRHAECEDCHGAHAVRAGTHARGTSSAGAALFGARGVVPAFGGGNFSTPTSFTGTLMSGLAGDYEAYVCFQCHSSYTTLPTTGGSAGFGATDLAVEYNPNNQSGHSVLGASTTWPKTTFGTFTWSWPSTTTAFISTYVPGLGTGYKMTCSDCHTYGASGARGPHGSATKFVLVLGGTTDWYRTTLAGWSTNFLCGRCHAKGSNIVHIDHHDSFTCERCHTRIPHGWKRPRMLVRYGTDTGAYVTTSTGSLAGFRQQSYTPNGWVQSDCNAGCTGNHSAAVSPVWP